jgi:hypothetical protein
MFKNEGCEAIFNKQMQLIGNASETIWQDTNPDGVLQFFYPFIFFLKKKTCHSNMITT